MSETHSRSQTDLGVAFFCSTPFQILLALRIRAQLHPWEHADLYVLDHFGDAQQVVQRVRQTEHFRKVRLVRSREFAEQFRGNAIARKGRMAKHQLRYRRTVAEYLDLPSEGHSHLYLTYPDVILQLAVRVALDRNPATAVHLYDDGTGSYGDAMLRMGRLRRGFNIATGNAALNALYTDRILLHPQMVEGSSNLPIRQAPHIPTDDKDFRQLANVVFGFPAREGCVEQDVVFLEQPFAQFDGLEHAIRDVVIAALPKDFLVKLHPRSTSDLYKGQHIYRHGSVPWEVLALNGRMEDKTLVSFFSTAATTGKMLFDEEPQVVFLFDIPELRQLFDLPETMRGFVDNFRSSHRDQSRVFVPSTTEELRHFFQNRSAV